MSAPLQLPAEVAVGQPKEALLDFARGLYIYRLPRSYFAQLILGMCLVGLTIVLSLIGLYQIYREGNLWLLRTRGRFVVSNPTTGFVFGLMTFQICYLGFLGEQLRVHRDGHLPTQMGYWLSGIWYPLWSAAYCAAAGSYFMQPDVCEYTPPYRASWLRRCLSRPVITNTVHLGTPIVVFAVVMVVMARTGSSYQEAVYEWQTWAAVVRSDGERTITEADRETVLDVWRGNVGAWEATSAFFTCALVLCIVTVLVYAPVAFQVCRAIRRRICEMRFPTMTNLAAKILAVPLWGETSDAPVAAPSTRETPSPRSELLALSRSTQAPQEHSSDPFDEERLRMLVVAWRHVVFQAVTVQCGVVLVGSIALVARIEAARWASQGPEALARSWSAMTLAITYGAVFGGFIVVFIFFRRIGDFGRRSAPRSVYSARSATPSRIDSPSTRKRSSHATTRGDDGEMATDSKPTRPKPARRATLLRTSRVGGGASSPENASSTWVAGLGRRSTGFSSVERPCTATATEREVIDLEVGPREVLARIQPLPRGATAGPYEGILLPNTRAFAFDDDDDDESLSNLFGGAARVSEGSERQATRDTLFVFGFSPGGGSGRRPGTASSLGTEDTHGQSGQSGQDFRWVVTPPSVNYEAGDRASEGGGQGGSGGADE